MRSMLRYLVVLMGKLRGIVLLPLRCGHHGLLMLVPMMQGYMNT